VARRELQRTKVRQTKLRRDRDVLDFAVART
jgi:hypothetical protein